MANLRADNLTGTGGRNAIDGSLFFNGKSSYLEMASGVLISGTGFGTNDFTIEFWINQGVNASNYTVLFAYTSSTAADRFEVVMHSSTIQVYTHTGAWRDTGYAPVSGQWEHIAFVRNYSGNTLKMYANGVEKWSVSNNHDYNEAGVTQIGSYGSTSYGYFEGYISNLRVLNGTALYTAAFAPPTEKLNLITNTILLCCQDSDNALQEATGKTITGYGRYFAATGELFANTGFSADSDWDKGTGWTISGGVATHAQGSAGDLAQQISGLVVGQTYKLSVDILTTDNDVAYFFIDNNPGGNYPTLTSADTSPVGYHQIFFEANATTMWLGFRGSSLWAGTLTNLRLSSYEAPNAVKSLPPVGVDEGVTFEGETKHNTQGVMYFPTGTTKERGGYSGRMIVGGGEVNASPGTTNVIEYLNFAHFSNAVDFGDLTQARRKLSSCSSSTRGIWAGGGSPGSTDRIDYVTIASVGDAIDFANLFTGVSDDSSQCFGGSNNTRGVFAGGYNNVVTIQYITIATTADAQDFGDLITGRFDHAGFASPTRAIFAGGKSTPAGNYNSIEYVTIATTGGGTDFGDMTAAVRGPAGLSNNIRGLMGGGLTPTLLNNIEYVTIATTGNAQDFGDLHQTRQEILAGGTSNNTRGVWAGGQQPAYVTKVDMVMIATTGNAVDFGNLTTGTSGAGSVSDSHGGLS